MVSRLTNNAIKVMWSVMKYDNMHLQKILESGETLEKPILQVLVSACCT